MQTSRKKRPLNRNQAHLRDSRLIIIAAEGRETEKQYFQLFQEDTRVQIKVLSTGVDNRSAPKHVLKRLKKFRNEYNLKGNDQLWLMVDVDRWGDKTLKDICQESKQCGFRLAISNPCFEVWLLCHFQKPLDTAKNCSDVEKLLRSALGGSYNKANLDLTQYSNKIETALNTAKSNDPNSLARWPYSVGTHVYRVVNEILALKKP